jgi:ribosome-associated protein
METDTTRWKDLLSECEISTDRNSGPGGQNVNKTETKVTLKFNIIKSEILDETEKILIVEKYKNLRLIDERYIQVYSQESRSQLKNKHNAVKKLIHILEEALKVAKPRKKTRPSKASLAEKREEKERTSVLKSGRGNLKTRISRLED